MAFPGVLLDVGQLEEAPPRMGEAKRRRSRQHLLLRIEQRLEAVVAISLQDTGEGGQMLLWMLASTVARGVIDRRRWRWPGEGPVIPHICPDPTGLALALRQDADGGVVAMQALGSKHMAFDQVEERHDGEGPVADPVGQRRQWQVDPLGLKARTLAIERDVHAELVEQNRRQQLWADEAARRGMERRRRLADLLAIAAGELFAHCLDDLEAARDLLQRLGHILADLRQPRSAAAGAARRSLDNDALVFDVVRPGLAYRPLAREGAHALGLRRRGLSRKLILARRGGEFFEFQFQLFDQTSRALGALPVQFAFELLDPQLEMRDQRLVVRQLRPRVGGIRDGHIAFSLQRLTLGQQRHVGTREVRRKSARLRCHEAIESDQAADSIVKRLSNSRWTPCFLRIAQSIPDKR